MSYIERWEKDWDQYIPHDTSPPTITQQCVEIVFIVLGKGVRVIRLFQGKVRDGRRYHR